jgi:hypothetical protein
MRLKSGGRLFRGIRSEVQLGVSVIGIRISIFAISRLDDLVQYLMQTHVSFMESCLLLRHPLLSTKLSLGGNCSLIILLMPI